MFFILINLIWSSVPAPGPLALVPGTTDIYRRWDPPVIAKGASADLATRYANNLKHAPADMRPKQFDGGILACHKNYFVFLANCTAFDESAADALIGLYTKHITDTPRPPRKRSKFSELNADVLGHDICPYLEPKDLMRFVRVTKKAAGAVACFLNEKGRRCEFDLTKYCNLSDKHPAYFAGPNSFLQRVSSIRIHCPPVAVHKPKINPNGYYERNVVLRTPREIVMRLEYVPPMSIEELLQERLRSFSECRCNLYWKEDCRRIWLEQFVSLLPNLRVLRTDCHESGCCVLDHCVFCYNVFGESSDSRIHESVRKILSARQQTDQNVKFQKRMAEIRATIPKGASDEEIERIIKDVFISEMIESVQLFPGASDDEIKRRVVFALQ